MDHPWNVKRKKAMSAYVKSDWISAREVYGQLAELGDHRSAVVYAHMLFDGRGGPIDVSESKRLLRRSFDSSAGLEARHLYAVVCLRSGERDEAISILTNLSTEKYVPAQARLGLLLVRSQTSPQDGLALLQAASASGNLVARSELYRLSSSQELSIFSGACLIVKSAWLAATLYFLERWFPFSEKLRF